MTTKITKTQLKQLVKEEVNKQVLKENKVDRAWKAVERSVKKLNPQAALVEADDYHEFGVIQDALKQLGLRYKYQELDSIGGYKALFWTGPKPVQILKQVNQVLAMYSDQEDGEEYGY